MSKYRENVITAITSNLRRWHDAIARNKPLRLSEVVALCEVLLQKRPGAVNTATFKAFVHEALEQCTFLLDEEDWLFMTLCSLPESPHRIFDLIFNDQFFFVWPQPTSAGVSTRFRIKAPTPARQKLIASSPAVLAMFNALKQPNLFHKSGPSGFSLPDLSELVRSVCVEFRWRKLLPTQRDLKDAVALILLAMGNVRFEKRTFSQAEDLLNMVFLSCPVPFEDGCMLPAPQVEATPEVELLRASLLKTCSRFMSCPDSLSMTLNQYKLWGVDPGWDARWLELADWSTGVNQDLVKKALDSGRKLKLCEASLDERERNICLANMQKLGERLHKHKYQLYEHWCPVVEQCPDWTLGLKLTAMLELSIRGLRDLWRRLGRRFTEKEVNLAVKQLRVSAICVGGEEVSQLSDKRKLMIVQGCVEAVVVSPERFEAVTAAAERNRLELGLAKTILGEDWDEIGKPLLDIRGTIFTEAPSKSEVWRDPERGSERRLKAREAERLLMQVQTHWGVDVAKKGNWQRQQVYRYWVLSRASGSLAKFMGPGFLVECEGDDETAETLRSRLLMKNSLGMYMPIVPADFLVNSEITDIMRRHFVHWRLLAECSAGKMLTLRLVEALMEEVCCFTMRVSTTSGPLISKIPKEPNFFEDLHGIRCFYTACFLESFRNTNAIRFAGFFSHALGELTVAMMNVNKAKLTHSTGYWRCMRKLLEAPGSIFAAEYVFGPESMTSMNELFLGEDFVDKQPLVLHNAGVKILAKDPSELIEGMSAVAVRLRQRFASTKRRMGKKMISATAIIWFALELNELYTGLRLTVTNKKAWKIAVEGCFGLVLKAVFGDDVSFRKAFLATCCNPRERLHETDFVGYTLLRKSKDVMELDEFVGLVVRLVLEAGSSVCRELSVSRFCDILQKLVDQYDQPTVMSAWFTATKKYEDEEIYYWFDRIIGFVAGYRGFRARDPARPSSAFAPVGDGEEIAPVIALADGPTSEPTGPVRRDGFEGPADKVAEFLGILTNCVKVECGALSADVNGKHSFPDVNGLVRNIQSVLAAEAAFPVVDHSGFVAGLRRLCMEIFEDKEFAKALASLLGTTGISNSKNRSKAVKRAIESLKPWLHGDIPDAGEESIPVTPTGKKSRDQGPLKLLSEGSASPTKRGKSEVVDDQSGLAGESPAGICEWISSVFGGEKLPGGLEELRESLVIELADRNLRVADTKKFVEFLKAILVGFFKERPSLAFHIATVLGSDTGKDPVATASRKYLCEDPNSPFFVERSPTKRREMNGADEVSVDEDVEWRGLLIRANRIAEFQTGFDTAVTVFAHDFEEMSVASIEGRSVSPLNFFLLESLAEELEILRCLTEAIVMDCDALLRGLFEAFKAKGVVNEWHAQQVSEYLVAQYLPSAAAQAKEKERLKAILLTEQQSYFSLDPYASWKPVVGHCDLKLPELERVPHEQYGFSILSGTSDQALFAELAKISSSHFFRWSKRSLPLSWSSVEDLVRELRAEALKRFLQVHEVTLFTERVIHAKCFSSFPSRLGDVRNLLGDYLGESLRLRPSVKPMRHLKQNLLSFWGLFASRQVLVPETLDDGFKVDVSLDQLEKIVFDVVQSCDCLSSALAPNLSIELRRNLVAAGLRQVEPDRFKAVLVPWVVLALMSRVPAEDLERLAEDAIKRLARFFWVFDGSQPQIYLEWREAVVGGLCVEDVHIIPRILVSCIRVEEAEAIIAASEGGLSLAVDLLEFMNVQYDTFEARKYLQSEAVATDPIRAEVLIRANRRISQAGTIHNFVAGIQDKKFKRVALVASSLGEVGNFDQFSEIMKSLSAK